MSKPGQETNLKAWVNSSAYSQKKEQLSKELSLENILTIDRTCFQKTQAEKIKLKQAKLSYKAMVKEEVKSGARKK